MGGTNNISSDIRIQNAFYNNLHSDKQVKLSINEKDFLYFIINQNIDKNDWALALSSIKSILEGKSIKLHENPSIKEKLAYKVISKILSNLGSNYTANPNSISDLNKKIAAFCQKAGIKYTDKTITKEIFKSIIETSIKIAIDQNKVGTSIDDPLKIIIKLALRKVLIDRKDEKIDHEKIFKEIENNILNGYKIKKPLNEQERIILEVYAETFRLLFKPQASVNWSKMSEEKILELVKKGLSNITNKDSNVDFKPIYHRIMYDKCITKYRKSITAHLGVDFLLRDLYVDQTNREVVYLMMKDILQGQVKSNIYINVSDKGEIKNVAIGDTYKTGNRKTFKNATNKPIYHIVSYIIAYKYGMDQKSGMDKNVLVNGLYQFCQENGFKNNIEYRPRQIQFTDGSSSKFNFTIKIDNKLLIALSKEYYRLRVYKREKIGTGKKAKYKSESRVSNVQYIADTSPIIAMKAVVVTRLGTKIYTSDLKEEILSAQDIIMGIAKVYAKTVYVKNIYGRLVPVEKESGLEKHEVEILNNFAKELEKGTYKEGSYSIRYRGRTGFMQNAIACLMPYSGGSIDEGKEKLYNDAMKILHKLGWQLSEITPQKVFDEMNVFEKASEMEKQQLKLAGAEQQLVMVLKSNFYKEQIMIVQKRYGALKSRGLKHEDVMKKMTKSDIRNLKFCLTDEITLKFWEKINKTLPHFSKAIGGNELFGGVSLRTSKGKVLDFPYTFYRKIDGKDKMFTVTSYKDLVTKVLELDKGWDTLVPQPAENEETTLAKKAFSLMIYQLGQFSSKEHDWLANAIGSMPVAGSIFGNVLLRTGSAILSRGDVVSTETKVMSDEDLLKRNIFNTDIKLGGLKLGVVNGFIKYFDMISQNQKSVKTSVAPYLWMFLLNSDPDKAVGRTLKMMSGHKDTIDRFSTVKPEFVKLFKDHIEKKLLPYINSFNVRAIVDNDKDLKEMEEKGVFKIVKDKGGKSKIEFDMKKLDEFAKLIKEQYNGEFKEFYAERTHIPNDKGIQDSAFYAVQTVMAIYNLMRLTQKQVGALPLTDPISADDINAGMIKAYPNEAKDYSFNRYFDPEGKTYLYMNFILKVHVTEGGVQKVIVDNAKKAWNEPIETLKDTAVSIPTTSLYFLSMQIYFMNQYKNWISDLIGLIATGDTEKAMEILNEMKDMGVQVANFSFNPLKPIQLATKMMEEGQPGQAIGVLTATLGFSAYVLSRDIQLGRNLLRGLGGLPRTEMRYGIWDLPVAAGERVVLRVEDYAMKGLDFAVNKAGKVIGKDVHFRRALGDAIEKFDFKMQSKTDQIMAGRRGKSASKPISVWFKNKLSFLWRNVGKTEFVYQGMHWTSEQLGKLAQILPEEVAGRVHSKRHRERIFDLQKQMYGEDLSKLNDAEIKQLDKIMIKNYSEQTGLKLDSPTYTFDVKGEQASFQLVGGKNGQVDVMHQYGNLTAVYFMPKVNACFDSLCKDGKIMVKNDAGLPALKVGTKGQTIPIREVGIIEGSGIKYGVFNYEGAPGVKMYIGADLAAKYDELTIRKLIAAGGAEFQKIKLEQKELIGRQSVAEALKKAAKAAGEVDTKNMKINGRSIDATISRIKDLADLMKGKPNDPANKGMTWEDITKLSADLEAQSKVAVEGIEEVKGENGSLSKLEKTMFNTSGTLLETAKTKGVSYDGIKKLILEGKYSLMEVRLAQAREVFRRCSNKKAGSVGDGPGQISKAFYKQIKKNHRFYNSRIKNGKAAMTAQLKGSLIMLKNLTSIQADAGEGKSVVGFLTKSVYKLTGKKIYSTTHDTIAALQLFKDVSIADKAIGIRTEYVDKYTMNAAKVQKKFATADVVITTQSDINFIILDNRIAMRTVEKIPIDYTAILLMDEMDFMLNDQSQSPHQLSGGSMGEKAMKSQWKRVWGAVDALYGSKYDKKNKKLPDDVLAKRALYFKNGQLTEKGMAELKWDSLTLVEQHMMKMSVQALFTSSEVEYVKMSLENRIYLIDKATGLLLRDNEFSKGQQQAIQAKEKVAVTPETGSYETATMGECLSFFKNKVGMSASLGDIAPLLASKGIKYAVLDTNVPRYVLDPGLNADGNFKKAVDVIHRAAALGVNFDKNKFQIEYKIPANATPEEIEALKQNMEELKGRLDGMVFKDVKDCKPVECSTRKIHQEQVFETRQAELNYLVNDVKTRRVDADTKTLKPVMFNVEDARFAFQIRQALIAQKEFTKGDIQMISYKNQEEMVKLIEKGLDGGKIYIITMARRAVDLTDNTGGVKKTDLAKTMVEAGTFKSEAKAKASSAYKKLNHLKDDKVGYDDIERVFTEEKLVIADYYAKKMQKTGILQYVVDRSSSQATETQKMGRAPRFGATGEIVLCTSYEDPVWQSPEAKQVIEEASKTGSKITEEQIKYVQQVSDNKMFVTEFITSKVNAQFTEVMGDIYEKLEELQDVAKPQDTLVKSLNSTIDRLFDKHTISFEKPVTKAQLKALGDDLTFMNQKGVKLTGGKIKGDELKQAIVDTYKKNYLGVLTKERTSLTSVTKDWNKKFKESFDIRRRIVEQYKADIVEKFNGYLGGIEVKIDENGKISVNAEEVKDTIIRIDDDGKVLLDCNKTTLLHKMIDEASTRINKEKFNMDNDILQEYHKAVFGLQEKIKTAVDVLSAGETTVVDTTKVQEINLSAYKAPLVYKVESGDAVISIVNKLRTRVGSQGELNAGKWDTIIDEACKANKLKSPDLIKPGQDLKIPDIALRSAEFIPEFTGKVQPGYFQAKAMGGVAYGASMKQKKLEAKVVNRQRKFHQAEINKNKVLDQIGLEKFAMDTGKFGFAGGFRSYMRGVGEEFKGEVLDAGMAGYLIGLGMGLSRGMTFKEAHGTGGYTQSLMLMDSTASLFSVKGVNLLLTPLTGKSLLTPSQVAQNAFNKGAMPFKALANTYFKNALFSFGATAPLLYLTGSMTEKGQALKQYYSMMLSNDPYTVEKAMSAVSIREYVGGGSNLLFEIPNYSLGRMGVKSPGLRLGASIGFTQIINALGQKYIADPVIEAKWDKIDMQEELDEEAGKLKGKQDREVIRQRMLGVRKDIALNFSVPKETGLNYVYWRMGWSTGGKLLGINKSQPGFLAKYGLKLGHKIIGDKASGVISKGVTKFTSAGAAGAIGQVLVPLYITYLVVDLGGEACALIYDASDPKMVSLEEYAATGKVMSTEEAARQDYAVKGRQLSFDIAKKLKDLGYMDRRTVLVSIFGENCLKQISTTEIGFFWDELMNAIETGNVDVLKGGWFKNTLSKYIRVADVGSGLHSFGVGAKSKETLAFEWIVKNSLELYIKDLEKHGIVDKSMTADEKKKAAIKSDNELRMKDDFGKYLKLTQTSKSIDALSVGGLTNNVQMKVDFMDYLKKMSKEGESEGLRKHCRIALSFIDMRGKALIKGVLWNKFINYQMKNIGPGRENYKKYLEEKKIKDPSSYSMQIQINKEDIQKAKSRAAGIAKKQCKLPYSNWKCGWKTNINGYSWNMFIDHQISKLGPDDKDYAEYLGKKKIHPKKKEHAADYKKTVDQPTEEQDTSKLFTPIIARVLNSQHQMWRIDNTDSIEYKVYKHNYSILQVAVDVCGDHFEQNQLMSAIEMIMYANNISDINEPLKKGKVLKIPAYLFGDKDAAKAASKIAQANYCMKRAGKKETYNYFDIAMFTRAQNGKPREEYFIDKCEEFEPDSTLILEMREAKYFESPNNPLFNKLTDRQKKALMSGDSDRVTRYLKQDEVAEAVRSIYQSKVIIPLVLKLRDLGVLAIKGVESYDDLSQSEKTTLITGSSKQILKELENEDVAKAVYDLYRCTQMKFIDQGYMSKEQLGLLNTKMVDVVKSIKKDDFRQWINSANVVKKLNSHIAEQKQIDDICDDRMSAIKQQSKYWENQAKKTLKNELENAEDERERDLKSFDMRKEQYMKYLQKHAWKQKAYGATDSEIDQSNYFYK